MPPEPEPRENEFRDYLSILARRWLTIVITTVLVVAAVVGYTYTQDPVYETSAQVLLQADSSDDAANPGERSIDTEILVFNSGDFRSRVAEKLENNVPAITAAPAGLTDVIIVSARSGDAKLAAAGANAAAETFIDFRQQTKLENLTTTVDDLNGEIERINGEIAALGDPEPNSTEAAELARLENRLESYRDQLSDANFAISSANSNQGRVITQAGEPSTPVEPKPERAGLIALAFGLLLGIGLAFLREYLDDTIKTKEDLERASGGVTVLGMIPSLAVWKRRDAPYVVSLADPQSPGAEAYRTLRTSIQFLGLDYPVRVLQVTSPNEQEGKTTTLANLAVTFAQAGRRVAVLDCDFRRPRMHEFFGLSNDIGFTSVLLGRCSVGDALQPVPSQRGLFLWASGPLPPNPSELLASDRTAEAIAVLRQHVEILVIDSPPVLPVTDALVLSSLVDATLLVSSSGRTSKRAVKRTVELLRQVGAPLVGSVLNGVVGTRISPYTGYGYRSYAPQDGAANGGRSARKSRA
jgi:polysaccharide biosynthesis transport protein